MISHKSSKEKGKLADIELNITQKGQAQRSMTVKRIFSEISYISRYLLSHSIATEIFP